MSNEKTCQHCGGTFRRKRHSHGEWEQRRYCSQTCSNRANGEEMKATWRERFFSYVQRGAPDDCWPWTGYKNTAGYGSFHLGGRKGRPELAHRISYVIANGPIPDGLCVRHRCDNPSCVNPKHLLQGTHLENMQDFAERGHGNRGEANGMYGKAAPNKGKPHSAATVAKCRANAFVSSHRLGSKHTEETKQLISERTRGKNTGPLNPNFKGVVTAYSLAGDFVGQYPSASAASAALGVSPKKISAVILGKARQSGGFVFHREAIAPAEHPPVHGSTVYLSGPMSGLPDFNRPAFYTAESALLAAGAARVFNPARQPDGLTWEEYLRMDLDGLRDCLASTYPLLARLPDWRRSRGATIENDIWSMSGERVIDLPSCSFSCRLLAA